MKLKLKFLSLFALIALINSSRDRNNQKYKIVCYWGSWSFYRPGNGKFLPEDVNPNICTHLIYGFTKLNADNTIGVFDPDLDTGDTDWNSGQQWGHGMYRRWNKLRSVNPHLTTLIAIGGWNEGSSKYSVMASNPASRNTFVNSVVQFLQKYDFDGLDLDWEYPAMKAVGDADRTPGNADDKQHFIDLLRELHTAFQPHGYILTSAVSAGKPTIDRAYNVPEMNKYLDIINVMTYDFHGAWENKTAHNAPLYSKPKDKKMNKQFTVEYAINYWIKLGADPKKMTLGMPLYGRTFTLAGTDDTGIYAPAIGAGGNPGPFTRLPGTLGYNEICELLKSGQWKVNRDLVQKIPYAVNGYQWIGYDDQQSIKDKVDFLKRKGLGGGMVWSIDTDDFKGLCGRGKYPLLKTISEELNGMTGSDPVETPENEIPEPETPENEIPEPETPEMEIPESETPEMGTPTIETETDTPEMETPDPKLKSTTQKPMTQKPMTQKPTTQKPMTQKPTTQKPTETTKKDGNADVAIQGGTTREFTCKKTGWFKDPKDPMAYHECVDMGNDKIKDFTYRCWAGTVYDEVKRSCKMV